MFNDQFAIDFKGAYFALQKALLYLNNGASIIITSAMADRKGIAGTSVLSAVKAALRSLVRTAAAELVERGIRVNAVAPGLIATAMHEKSGLPKEAVDAFAKETVAQVPMKWLGQPEEVAATVVLLASEDASYITGVEINVGGGIGQL